MKIKLNIPCAVSVGLHEKMPPFRFRGRSARKTRGFLACQTNQKNQNRQEDSDQDMVELFGQN